MACCAGACEGCRGGPVGGAAGRGGALRLGADKGRADEGVADGGWACKYGSPPDAQPHTTTATTQCAAEADAPGACRLLADDYMECLHHRKEYARYNEILKREKELKKLGKAPPRPTYT